MNLEFNGSASLAPLKELLPAMAEMSPSGDAKFTTRVTGAPKPGVPPDVRGSATLSNLGATIASLPKPVTKGTANVEFTAKTARVSNASFTVGSSVFRVNADVASMTPMQATYTVTSAAVARLDVQAPAPNAKPLPREEVFRDVRVEGTAREQAPKVIQNDIVLTSKSGVVANIDYTNLEASVQATPEKSIIEKFSANTMGGTISGAGTFEPKASTFDLKAKVDKVNLAEYFNYKSPALADVLVGRISADFDIAGSGKTWEELQNTLTGNGGATVIEGALLNVNLTQQLFASVEAMPMVPQGLVQNVKNKNPELFGSDKTVFENLAGKVSIADGRINTNDLHLKAAGFSLTGGGWLSFAKTLDLSTTLTLSQKLTNDLVAEVPAAKYLLNSSGRFEVPLKLSGAVAKPSVGVDAAAIQTRLQQGFVQQGKDELQKKATDTVKGLLDGLGKKTSPPAPEPAKPDTTRG
jgi:uncharacterized protein involved in outer membrane biogenesis